METTKTVTILLVEDDPGDQKLIKYALSGQQPDGPLKVVGTGEEALAYLEGCKNHQPDKPRPGLILLDLNMPGMGGKEFLRLIKKDEQLCDIPVVIVSTSDSEKDVQECYKLHAAGYVQKSPSPEQLTRVIHKLTKYWFATSSLVRN